MFIRRVLPLLLGIVLCVGVSVGQLSPSPAPGSNPSPETALAIEFPVVLQQSIIAGKTPPGTRVQASLVVGTLLNGKVVPRNAVLSGQIIESVAKAANAPARLSIRMDSAQWKDGSAPLQAYLTLRYYPVTQDSGPDLQYGPEQPAKATWNGMGQYPDRSSHTYKPFPSGSDADKDASPPSAPVTSKQPTAMKNVESERNSTGGITLVSNRSNLKLDKVTTYIFATGDVPGTAK